jgi:hypothetical protein
LESPVKKFHGGRRGGLILDGGEGERRPTTGGTRMDYKTGENCSIFVVYRKTGLARFLIKPRSIYSSKEVFVGFKNRPVSDFLILGDVTTRHRSVAAPIVRV